MIIGVTGHVASGKTSFVLRYAASFGREGLFVMVGSSSSPEHEAFEGERGFRWKTVKADTLLPQVMDVINRESNVFRADRRVVVIDGADRYFTAVHEQLSEQQYLSDEQYEQFMYEKRLLLEYAVSSYQGKLFVVTGDPGTITPFMTKRERCYHMQLAQFNRVLAEQSHQWFRMSAGLVHELRGNKFRG
ncbi:bifunctional adenosylcobinamide kinase/adenosylcobinamide-phosphate guanylyltransferase [Paenibacillus sp. SC116]|uniref:bifunctional adenosylcobinamide kinase/adenosylcobinamide-phosphate guanylyltransferase n=1 Tax=Paenibacillus sp. SC116 TaxID=2968986 RepID=UPI00215AA92D|nr:bifunctional adenosylcobinamide kinase/adenosylcobinamide-phosphate guanylyltransferase [Paenibacillus sp. SC116]MCR8843809.1 bifunctional adenosylcobinamide kinase/adenosylcobinamide-phosphate guanylyltransferase [Paenibacillus sp. SC116]